MRRVVHHAVLLPFRAQSTSYVSFPRREKKSTVRESKKERERERESEREREKQKQREREIEKNQAWDR